MTAATPPTSPGVPVGNHRSVWRWLLLVVTLVPVLGVTLVPSGDVSVVTSFIVCVICGEFGTANLIRNVVLFVPLGMPLALLLGPGRWALVALFAITATIETLQFHIPGRNPMVADIAANFTGGAFSVLAVRWAPWWLDLQRARGARLSFVCGVLTTGILLGTGWLYTVDLPETEYWGQWTPRLGHLARYDGEVLGVSIGGLDARSWRLDDPDAVRSAILAGKPIEVQVELGPSPGALASIFSVYDGEQQEIVLLGAHREHFVSRVRYRAHDYFLDRPDMRLLDAFRGFEAGDTVTVGLRVAGGGSCMSVEGIERCDVSPGLERGWALLKYLEGPPERFRTVLDFAWMLALLLPYGFFMRWHVWSGLGALLLAPTVMGGWWLDAVSGPQWWGVAGAVAGVLMGFGLGAGARRQLPSSAGSAVSSP